jgi:hypothetical protein
LILAPPNQKARTKVRAFCVAKASDQIAALFSRGFKSGIRLLLIVTLLGGVEFDSLGHELIAHRLELIGHCTASTRQLHALVGGVDQIVFGVAHDDPV